MCDDKVVQEPFRWEGKGHGHGLDTLKNDPVDADRCCRARLPWTIRATAIVLRESPNMMWLEQDV